MKATLICMHHVQRTIQLIPTTKPRISLSEQLLSLVYIIVRFVSGSSAAVFVRMIPRSVFRVVTWTSTLQYYTRYSSRDLKVCCEVLLNAWRRVRQHGFRGVQKRYVKSKRHAVSEIAPLEGLPECVFVV